MRHAFVPMTNGSPRCARCLRMLDCAPHLPIAPGPTWYVLSLDHRNGMTIDSPRLAKRRLLDRGRAPAASRAAR